MLPKLVKPGLVMLASLVLALTTWVADGTAAITVEPWPGGGAVQPADAQNWLSPPNNTNLSGLTYEGSGSSVPGVLWAVRNGPERLYRLLWSGAVWMPDTANSWSVGKQLRYPDGAGQPDAEGVTFGASPAGGVYVSTERNNAANTISRNSVLRFEVTGAGTELTATHEWNLTASLPATGANLGIEAITWIPDAFLVEKGFFDESKGHTYSPSEYPNHAGGLFFVGVEANGQIHAVALNHTDSSFSHIATIISGFTGVMALEFDRELELLWAICDNTCDGRAAVLEINTHPSSATVGRFGVSRLFDRPTGMPNLNNEGFVMAPLTECTSNLRPAFWADDGGTGGHAIRAGTMDCGPLAKDDCKAGNWEQFALPKKFKNQGDCVQFSNTGN